MCIRDRAGQCVAKEIPDGKDFAPDMTTVVPCSESHAYEICLLYTSDAADDLLCVDLGGRRIIKKKKTYPNITLYHQHPPQILFLPD